VTQQVVTVPRPGPNWWTIAGLVVAALAVLPLLPLVVAVNHRADRLSADVHRLTAAYTDCVEPSGSCYQAETARRAALEADAIARVVNDNRLSLSAQLDAIRTILADLQAGRPIPPTPDTGTTVSPTPTPPTSPASPSPTPGPGSLSVPTTSPARPSLLDPLLCPLLSLLCTR
jgi:hypothetical protein